MKYLATIQGGEGPAVWKKEAVIDGATFLDAARLADGKAIEEAGHVVLLELIYE
jgi:hypothetical protein